MRTYTACPGCGEYVKYLGDRRNLTHAFCDDPLQPQWDLEKAFIAALIAGDEARADTLAASLDSLGKGPPRLREAALMYAADYGWPVFPLKPGQKVPATAHGFKDATTDPRAIREWWRRWPRANIGLPTGQFFDVLDVDFKHGAAPAWLRMKESDKMPAAHGISVTPSSGLHVLLLPAGGGNLAGAGKLPGIDYRGDGGYIVAPPSVLANGRNYMWDVKPSPMVQARSHRPSEPEFPPPRPRPIRDVHLPEPDPAPEYDPNQTSLFDVEGAAAP